MSGSKVGIGSDKCPNGKDCNMFPDLNTCRQCWIKHYRAEAEAKEQDMK